MQVRDHMDIIINGETTIDSNRAMKMDVQSFHDERIQVVLL